VADGLFALPLLMTGETVRDIGVGAGVGQWVQQGVNGVRDLEGAGGGDWRPTQRMPAARAPLNHVPTFVRGEGVGRRDWLLVRVVPTLRVDTMTTRIGRSGWSQRAATWRLNRRVNGCLETTGVTWGNVPLTRRFSFPATQGSAARGVQGYVSAYVALLS
jgi:hypothetical protein